MKHGVLKKFEFYLVSDLWKLSGLASKQYETAAFFRCFIFGARTVFSSPQAGVNLTKIQT